MFSKQDKELQQYYDGELCPRRARKMKAWLEQTPPAQKQIDGLRHMQSLLKEAHEAGVEEANFDRLWTNIHSNLTEVKPASITDKLRVFIRRYGMAFASASAVTVVALVLLWVLGDSPIQNDCDIESLDVDPNAVTTIFKIDLPEKEGKNSGDKDGQTTVIWVNDELPASEGENY